MTAPEVAPISAVEDLIESSKECLAGVPYRHPDITKMLKALIELAAEVDKLRSASK